MSEMASNQRPETQSGPVLAEYLDRLQKSEIDRDEEQYKAVLALDQLAISLTTHDESPSSAPFQWLWNSKDQEKHTTPGLYLYGSVGRGKTMLMDMFFEKVPVIQKRRWHFHEFMAEIHEKIARARKKVDGDPIPSIAATMAKNTKLLCFDELHVTDIADAMILSRLFEGLYKNGVVVVATSNAHPEELYKNGLNRPLFLPFIQMIQENMAVHEVKASKDFRLDKLSGRQLYFSPVDQMAREQMDAHWHRLTGDHPASPMKLELKGRFIDVPLASMGVARFKFADLCEKPLGSLDFLRIAHEFHTILIDDIPKLSPENRNDARRFINLIDTLYDTRVCLIASAQAPPENLYMSGDGSDLFERTASRLTEMRSEAYLSSRI